MAKQMMDIGLYEVDGGEDCLIVGDFTVVESTAMHQRQLILDNMGDFKATPTVGVGAFNYFDDENPQDLLRAINVQFTQDGMDVKSVAMAPSKVINTDAYYK